jgi:hypothetical protein
MTVVRVIVRLRWIERDLHDGAQVRLTALAMTLGELKETWPSTPAMTSQ